MLHPCPLLDVGLAIENIVTNQISDYDDKLVTGNGATESKQVDIMTATFQFSYIKQDFES